MFHNFSLNPNHYYLFKIGENICIYSILLKYQKLNL